MKGLSSEFAEFIVGAKYDILPQGVVTQAKRLILDLVGVSMAGYKLMKFPQEVVGYLVKQGGSPEATIIQAKGKYPAMNAALANGACAHALDMDDGHRIAGLHPGTAVIPAAMAAAELARASAKQLITGIVVGYEIMIRIGMAMFPSCLLRGFHPTGIVGPFGAVAAAANVMPPANSPEPKCV